MQKQSSSPSCTSSKASLPATTGWVWWLCTTAGGLPLSTLSNYIFFWQFENYDDATYLFKFHSADRMIEHFVTFPKKTWLSFRLALGTISLCRLNLPRKCLCWFDIATICAIFRDWGKSNKLDWCKIHIVVCSRSLFWSEMDMERLLEEDAVKESVSEGDDQVKIASKNLNWIGFYLKVNVFKPQPEVMRLLRQQGIQLLTKRWRELSMPMDFEFWFSRFWQRMQQNEKTLYV